MSIQVIGSGRHRRPTLLERALDRPIFALVVGAAVAFITSAFLTVVR